MPTHLRPFSWSLLATPRVSSPPTATTASSSNFSIWEKILPTPSSTLKGLVLYVARMVPPRGRMPEMKLKSRGNILPSMSPSQPFLMPRMSKLYWTMPFRVTARMTALSPGQSPPPVRIPTLMVVSSDRRSPQPRSRRGLYPGPPVNSRAFVPISQRTWSSLLTPRALLIMVLTTSFAAEKEEKMPAKIISGKEVSCQIREELKVRAARLKEKGIVPGLGVVLVGEDPASVSYVTAKAKAAEEIGIFETTINMPAASSEEDVLRMVDSLNRDDRYNGVLVQLPLPKYVSADKVINFISPEKDVDGFHPVNVGTLLRGG